MNSDPNGDQKISGEAPDKTPDKTPDETAPVGIRLDQFLQLCGVPTGGQAKMLIQGGEVKLNGEVETRRRKKLVPGDSIEFDGETFDVAVEE